jgi:hypothetical protein
VGYGAFVFASRGELRLRAGRWCEGKRESGDLLEKDLADSLAKRTTQAYHRA